VSRYIYAILSALPISLMMLWFGYDGIMLTEDKLDKKTGIIEELIIEAEYSELKLKSISTRYNTSIPDHVSKISKELKKGDLITIYKIRGSNNMDFIEKLVKDGKVLIEFDKAPLVPWISFVLGLMLLISVIIYLYQNFSDLFGGDKEKMEDFLDPWRKDKK
jgi:hypothetical protein